jgi:hypothetical protein
MPRFEAFPFQLNHNALRETMGIPQVFLFPVVGISLSHFRNAPEGTGNFEPRITRMGTDGRKKISAIRVIRG